MRVTIETILTYIIYFTLIISFIFLAKTIIFSYNFRSISFEVVNGTFYTIIPKNI